MESERTMISLEELFIYLLKKWKIIAAIMIVCMVLIVGAVWLFFEKKFVETDFLYKHYEELVKETEEYQYNSPIMLMDYNEVYRKNIQLENIFDAETLKQYVLSEKIWENYVTETPKKYLPELVYWNETDNDTVILAVRYSAEMGSDYVDYLARQLETFDSEIQITISEESVAYDEEIRNRQIQSTTLYRHYTEQMKISRVGYVQETAVTSAVVFAAVLGIILSFSIVFSQFLKTRQVCEEEAK